MSPWKKRPRADHPATAARAKAALGAWVLVNTYPSTYTAKNIARSIRTGYRIDAYRPSPAGHFESRVEPTGDVTEVWTRYVATAAEAAPALAAGGVA